MDSTTISVIVIALAGVVIICVFFKDKIFVSRDEQFNALASARNRALTADSREDFIWAIHDLYPFIHPRRAFSSQIPLPPEDYVSLWSEFHNLLLPQAMSNLNVARFLWWLPIVLEPFLLLGTIITFYKAQSTSDRIIYTSFGVFVCVFIPFMFYRVILPDSQKRVTDLKKIDERFRLFLTPEESNWLYSYGTGPPA